MDRLRFCRNDLRKFTSTGLIIFVIGAFHGKFGTDIKFLCGTAVELKNRVSLEWDFIRMLFLRSSMEKRRLIVCEIMVLKLAIKFFLRIRKQEHFLAMPL